MKRKVLLVYANAMSDGHISIGISMLSAVLKEKYEIKLFDTTFYPKIFTEMRKWREKTLEYKKLDDGLPPLNTTDLYEDFDKLYNEFKPDLVAVSATSTDYELGLSLLKNVEVPVLFGGLHATIAPEDVISHPKVTHIFRGEAEEIIANLVEKVLNGESLDGFKGVWYKKDGRLIKNEGVPVVNDLNNLPIPDWSIFDDRHFLRPFKGKVYRVGAFELSRGCPYSCTYCVNHIMQKLTGGAGHYREKSVDKAIDEVKKLTKEFNIGLIKFWDENFLGFKKNSTDFLKRYIEEVGLPFMIQTRPEGLTEEFAQLLKKANCVNLSLGIESGNENTRRNFLKRYPRNEDIIRGFKIARKYGLRTTAFIILGLPNEARKEVFDSINLVRECQPSVVNTFLLYPYKGTEIREWCIKNGWLDPNSRQEYVDTHQGYILKNPNFTEDDLQTLRKVFSLYVYTDPKYYSIIERAEKDELLYSFLNELYAKIIHGY